MNDDPEVRPLEADHDAALARALRRGSTAALDALYRRHADAVYRAAYRVSGSAADAEDVLQDVFVGLRRALERYEERGAFGEWLRAVAVRTALMGARRRTRRREAPLDAVPECRAAAGSPGAEERIFVRRALAAMPEPLRVVFLLKEVEGYGHHEIAAALDIRPGTARVRLHRAWRFLEAYAEDHS